MPDAVDPAILEALGLEAAASSKLVPHGGSGFAATFKLVATNADGREVAFFIKTGHGADAETMFRGPLFSPFSLSSKMLRGREINEEPR